MFSASTARLRQLPAIGLLVWFGHVRICAAEPSAAEKEMARALVVEGDRSFAAQEFERALERYREAFELVPVPTVGIEVVRTERALSRLLEAKATAIRVMNFPVEPDEPGVFAGARASAEAIAHEIDEQIPWIRVRANTPVSIQLDGIALSTSSTELPLRMNPGRHVLSLSAPGYQTVQRVIELGPAERREEAVELLPLPPPPAITAPPVVEALATPAAMVDNSAAAHPEARMGLGTLVAIGVGGLGVVTGGVTGTLALTEAAEARKHCEGDDDCRPEAESYKNRSEKLGNVATVSFVVAGAAAAFAAWQLFFNNPNPVKPAVSNTSFVRIEPVPGGAGLSAGGTF
jgi:hypothetical protein